MNGSENERDEDETRPGGVMSELECVETGTGFAAWWWSSSGARLKQMQLRARSTLSCEGLTSRNQTKANYWRTSSRKMENSCVKRRKETCLKTQTTGRELGELDPPTRTNGYFEELKAPKEDDAKML